MKKPYNTLKYLNILTKDFLIKEYIINKKSTCQIAKMIGSDHTTIRNYLIRYNISIRTHKDVCVKWDKILTKKFLHKEYMINKKSTCQIAKEIGCSSETIINYLKKYNIKRRTYKEATKGINDKYSKILTKEFLYREYIINKKSSLQIAKEINCSKTIVLKYLKTHKIKIRTNSESNKIKHNSFKTEFKKGMITWNKGLTKEKDNRIKTYALEISKTRKNKFKGKNNPMYGKKAAHGKGAYYKQSWMRSSWEIAYAKYCIINHIKYRYEPKAFAITYKYEGKKKEGTYRPDFYLPEQKLYIEIKGYWRADAKVKFNAFKRQYKDIKINILSKNELKINSII